MNNVILLLVSLSAGIIFRQTRVLPDNASKVLNGLLIYFFMPALSLLYVPETKIDERFIIPVGSAWFVYLLSFFFFSTVARWQNFDRKTLGALIMTGGIGSTSFVGFPLFELFYGQEGLEVGIIMSMAGTIMVSVTLGVGTGVWFSAEKPTLNTFFADIIRFPPFVAFVVALLANWAGYQHPDWIRDLLQKICSPYSLIALLTIGLQIQFTRSGTSPVPLLTGLTFKLFLAPFVVYAILMLILRPEPMILEITVLGAGIGSMNMISIVAAQMGLNPPLAARMSGIGIPLSLLTLYLFHLLLFS